MTRYEWVLARKAEGFPTTMCVRVAGVTRQGFYAWQAKQRAGLTERETGELALVGEIRRIHADSGGAYGSPRVTAQLRSQGHKINPKRVARLMKAHQIAGTRQRRRPKPTTMAAHDKPGLPDLVRRRFAAGQPDRAWVSDITYIHTGGGWLYLAVVLDLGSRRLLGYSMNDRINAELVADALNMAGEARGGRTGGIVFHSDRGSQYTAAVLQRALKGWGLAQSVGQVGSSADNAVAEAFFATLKREHTNQHHWPDRATARRSIFEWLTRYNTHRIHTTLNSRTPNQYENEYHHTNPPPPTT